ncbi:hypothetical protein BDV95DRAFT_309315 [Massariosphaeria phaeospora]|uniref:Uncharacterized protein n=1 Tax=Massariosphaeria phaeospora TaxID=100035 RepID=A0A7C8IET5_9PLEO|nr:hypothetical protein BDV95DRAFT_309315 [Massariosphaeria phaeospora]
MSAASISICKFVGTISLGLLTGASASLTIFASSLRNIASFSIFAAYILSPRRARHPYMLYTSVLALFTGPGIDYAMALREGSHERRAILDLEAQGEDVNGEQVRHAVERMRATEGVRTLVGGVAFVMQVVGIWGDGA